MKQLRKDITKGKLEQAYLFIGSETFLMKEIIDLMRDSLNDPSLINYASFNGEEMRDLQQGDDFISLCMTIPFISNRRIVVLHNVHKIPGSIMDKISEHLSRVPLTTTLVFTIEYSTKPSKSAEKLENQRARTLERLIPSLKKISFDKPRDSDTVRWIMDRVQSHGKKIDRDAAYLLKEITDSNTWLMATEIEKLCMYTPDDKAIGIKDVEETVMYAKEASIFKYLDDLFDRKKDALHRLFDLESQGIEPMIIVNMLERATISHYQVFKDLNPIPKGGHPKIKGEWKIKPRKNLWSSGQLLRLLGDIRDLEVKIKTGKSMHPYANLAEISARYAVSKGRGYRV